MVKWLWVGTFIYVIYNWVKNINNELTSKTVGFRVSFSISFMSKDLCYLKLLAAFPVYSKHLMGP